MTKIDWLHHEETTTAEAISALQAQDLPKPTAESVQNVKDDDLVSRKAAIDVAENAFVRGLLASPDIRRLPSAQPEIIRCRDCIWYELPSHKIAENCVRWMKSNGILLPIKPDDFCSRAERRTDDANDIT